MLLRLSARRLAGARCQAVTCSGLYSSTLALSVGATRNFANAAKLAKRAKVKKAKEELAAREKAEKAAKAELVGRYSANLKRFKPTTPSLRHTVLVDRSDLWKGRPVKSLTVGKRKKGGRNNAGRITVRHRGGGHKQLYRLVDFKRRVQDVPGIVQRLEYDPNRSANIALLAFPTGEVSYILAPDGMATGDEVTASRTQEVDIQPGNAMPLGSMPIGTVFHNLELKVGKGGQIARSAGVSCQLLDKNAGKQGYGLVAICSKEQRYVRLECMATVGTVGNGVHFLRKLGKAGRKRWLGWRPRVRGVAMNPVDHPMGGGEGRSSGGRASCSPTGVLSKGFKTRRKPPNPLVVVPRGGIKKQTRR
jgi:large subunit ribosomal protein L2